VSAPETAYLPDQPEVPWPFWHAAFFVWLPKIWLGWLRLARGEAGSARELADRLLARTEELVQEQGGELNSRHIKALAVAVAELAAEMGWRPR